MKEFLVLLNLLGGNMKANNRVWRVFTFAGWWLIFIGVALAALFLVSYVPDNIAAIALSIIGFILAIVGETILTAHHDKKHRFIWEGVSLAGIFLLAGGLLWVARMYYMEAVSLLGLFLLIIIGIVLVFLGETQMTFKKKK